MHKTNKMNNKQMENKLLNIEKRTIKSIYQKFINNFEKSISLSFYKLQLPSHLHIFQC